MSRRVLLAVAWIAVVIAAVIIDLALAGRRQLGDEGIVSCPMYFSAGMAATLSQDHTTDQWEIYREDGQNGTAIVKVSRSAAAPLPGQASCALNVLWAPERAGAASDWRIGHMIRPEAFRGRNVLYRVALKAQPDMHFDTAEVYAYDGVKAVGTGISRVDAAWRTFDVKMKVDPAAPTFQVWLRLLIGHGTVKPGSGTLYFVPELELPAG